MTKAGLVVGSQTAGRKPEVLVVYSPDSSGNVAPVATFADGADPQFVRPDGPTRCAVGFYPNNSSGTPDSTLGEVASLPDYSTPVTPGAPGNFHPEVVIDIPNVGSFTSKSSGVCAGFQTYGPMCFANPIIGTNDMHGKRHPDSAIRTRRFVNTVALRLDGKLAVANTASYGQPAAVTTFDFGSFRFDGSLQYPTPTFFISGAAAGSLRHRRRSSIRDLG